MDGVKTTAIQSTTDMNIFKHLEEEKKPQVNNTCTYGCCVATHRL